MCIYIYIYIYVCIYVHTLHKQVLQLHKVNGCTLRRRKVAVRQSCLTAALPIVSSSLCLSCRLVDYS